jgi:hypothetical protein
MLQAFLPSPLPMLLPPSDNPATVKNQCSLYPVNKIFNLDYRKCHKCLRKLICFKCQTSSSEYNIKYGFKYI